MIYLWILFFLLFGGNFDAEAEFQRSEDLLTQLEEIVLEKAEQMKVK